MNNVQREFKDAEKSYGSELLNHVVAKVYFVKLVENEAVRSWLPRLGTEIIEQFELVINTTSMEGALDQHLQEKGQSGASDPSENAAAASDQDIAAE